MLNYKIFFQCNAKIVKITHRSGLLRTGDTVNNKSYAIEKFYGFYQSG